MSWQWEVVYGIVRGRCSRYNGHDATQELPTRDCETRAILVNYTWYRTQSPLSTLLTRPKTAPQLPTGRMDADTRLSLCVFRQLDLSTSYFFPSSRSLLTCRIPRRNWRTVSDTVKYVYIILSLIRRNIRECTNYCTYVRCLLMRSLSYVVRTEFAGVQFFMLRNSCLKRWYRWSPVVIRVKFFYIRNLL